MIDIESIGSRVKYHRIRNKISQEELADLAQVSRVHISYLERGERIPSMESFINIERRCDQCRRKLKTELSIWQSAPPS